MGFLLCLMKALLASSTSTPISWDHQGIQNEACLGKGKCFWVTSFIQEIKKLTEKSISETQENFLGTELISLTISLMASSSAFFHSGHSSNKHHCRMNKIKKD